MVQKRNRFNHIVIADVRSPRDGRFIEKIGTYNPLYESNHPDRVRLEVERVRYWLSVGSQPTERISRFLEKAGLLPTGMQKLQKQKLQKQGFEKDREIGLESVLWDECSIVKTMKRSQVKWSTFAAI